MMKPVFFDGGDESFYVVYKSALDRINSVIFIQVKSGIRLLYWLDTDIQTYFSYI